jgi:C-terminal processing protease CtpA/Prc
MLREHTLELGIEIERNTRAVHDHLSQSIAVLRGCPPWLVAAAATNSHVIHEHSPTPLISQGLFARAEVHDNRGWMPVRAARRGLLALLVAVAGCAAAAPHSAAPGASDGVLARRVIDILEHRHVTHRKLDAATRASALAARPEADAAMLDALAKRYDPHSAYVPPAALSALRAEIAGDVAQDQLARGRIVEHAGVRVGWIALPSFYLLHDGRSSTSDLRFVATQLAERGAQLLLLDLRGNGGGVIAEAVQLAGALSGPGTVAYERIGEDPPEALSARAAEPIWRGPLVVWLDARTASVSELFAAALQDRGRALVIGQRSYGKGTGQSLVLLSSPLGASSGAVRVTDRFFFRVDGSVLQRNGVTPDIAIAAAPRTTERDDPRALVTTDITALERAPRSPLDPALVDRVRTRSAAQGANADPEQTARSIAVAYLEALGARSGP